MVRIRILTKGFTLIETLVAISLLSVAIVAPMALTVQSLNTAYYARDQITAFYLAQEAIEAVHALRDDQILCIAQSTCSGGNNSLFGPIPISDSGASHPFTIDARQTDPATAIALCSNPDCSDRPLQTDGTLYGYGFCSDGSCNTNFTRTVTAKFVGSGQDELRITVVVTWKTGPIQSRSFSIQSNLYRWVDDGVGAQ